MSRLIKRVPLDFAHGPDDGTWPGYVRECDVFECGGCVECEDEEPPEGDGWQVWQDVSEGSPISPVFAERDSVVAWLVENEDCAAYLASLWLEEPPS